MKLYIEKRLLRTLNKEQVSAYAFHLFAVKMLNGNMLKHWSVNALHGVTGVHPDTIRKYLAVLERDGRIMVQHGHLVFLKLKKRCKKRNVEMPYECCSLKEIEDALYVLKFLLKLEVMEYIKLLIKCANNPSRDTPIEVVKRAIKMCGYYGYGKEFVDGGISIDSIAKELGVSRQKAHRIVKLAVNKQLVLSIRRQVSMYIKGVGHAIRYVDDFLYEDFTFVTQNNAYKICANSYTLLWNSESASVVDNAAQPCVKNKGVSTNPNSKTIKSDLFVEHQSSASPMRTKVHCLAHLRQ
jgi:DNA-binding transcriptional regulator YhcF (GntR family)